MLEDCEKLESELKRTLESLQDCRKRRQALVEEIQSLKKKVKALHVQLPKYSMDVADCDTTREQLTKTIPQLRTQCKLSKEELDKLEELNKKVQECKKNLDSSALTTSKLEGEIASLQKSILDAGGPELKKQQALCKKIVSETREAEGKLNSERVSVTKLEKAAKKAMEAKASAVQGLESCKQTLEKKQVEINSLDEDAAEVMKAFERVKVEEAEQREKLEAVSKECETLKQSQSEIKCIEIDLLVQAEGFEKQIAECSKKSKHWSTEIKKLLAAAKEDDDDYASVDDTEGDGPPVGLAQEDDDGDAIMEDKDEEAPQDTNDLPDSQRSPLPTFSFETLEKYDVEAVGQDIEVLESERSALAKNANMGAIAEYRKKEADYLSR
jgi:structural maintenance of chromosome 4